MVICAKDENFEQRSVKTFKCNVYKNKALIFTAKLQQSKFFMNENILFNFSNTVNVSKNPYN